MRLDADADAVMTRSAITACGDLVRATVWTEHGSSSMTFKTASEARSWVPVAVNRKPLRKSS